MRIDRSPPPYPVWYRTAQVPEALIAQQPAVPRDSSRLMVVRRATGEVEHRVFRELPDVLAAEARATGRRFAMVANNSKVVDCLLDVVCAGGKRHVVYLLEKVGECRWLASGETLAEIAAAGGPFTPEGGVSGLRGEMHVPRADGLADCHFELLASDEGSASSVSSAAAVDAAVSKLLRVPLPPYVRSREGEAQYDTVYAKAEGSVAAPTAGLHFTERVLERLKNECDVPRAEVTLHVGYGTFAHIESDALKDHAMHPERVSVSTETAEAITSFSRDGRELLAVGTTATRTLESLAKGSASDGDLTFDKCEGSADLFIWPGGHTWRAVGALLTNFHMPGLTPVCLVASFMGAKSSPQEGYELCLKAYRTAVQEKYRFYSFGDSMLVL